MLRSLGLGVAFKWFIIACIGLAVWRGFNGDLGAIANTIWHWIEAGSDVVTKIYKSVNTDKAAN